MAGAPDKMREAQPGWQTGVTEQTGESGEPL